MTTITAKLLPLDQLLPTHVDGDFTMKQSIYTSEGIEDLINILNTDNKVFGEMRGTNPHYKDVIDLEQVSHILSNFRVENDNLIADVRFLKTWAGELAQRLHDINGIAFAFRGTANIRPTDFTNNITGEKLGSVRFTQLERVIAFDAVARELTRFSPDPTVDDGFVKLSDLTETPFEEMGPPYAE